MRKKIQSTFVSPRIIVSSVTVNAGVILNILVILSAGCTEEASIDDIISNAPKMCLDFCQAEYECEWGHGKEFEEAKRYFQDSCVIDCAFYTENGAMIIKRSQSCADELKSDGGCISFEEHEEPSARVLGEVVELYFECLWGANLFQCGDGSFGLYIENEDACGAYAGCIDLLEYPFFEGVTWNSETSACEIPKRNDGDTWYYLEVML